MDELMQIADFAKRHNLVVLSDEVYEWMVFDGVKHERIGSLPGYA
jgi:aspartate/methionine/tyrosine aminotransferase